MFDLVEDRSTGAGVSAPPSVTIVILLGPPGAGKGTHAPVLSRKLNIPHISTGDLFRENIKNHTPLGVEAKSFINRGCLAPDPLVLDMLFHRLAKSDCKNGYILDGFPRTLAQAQRFEEKILDSSSLVVLNLNISDEKIIERISGRISCKGCTKTYHKKYDPPKEKSCSHCGSELFQRDDDSAEVVAKRLEVYREETKPLIQYYGEKKGVLRQINSEEEKSAVSQSCLLNFLSVV